MMRLLRCSLGLVLGIALMGGVPCEGRAANALGAAPASLGWRHGQPPRAGLGGAIDLTDHHGQAFSLGRVQGRVALVFFGFSRCTTVCPQALFQAHQVLEAFKARPAPAILFVTLDPLSDDPAQLGQFLSHIDGRLMGLTGPPQRVAAVAERYGVGLSGQGAGLEHSAKWYLLGTQGRLERVYDLSTPVSALVEDVRRAQQAHGGAR